MLKDEKGITFSIMSETEAAEYLSKRNNYMRTASYRKNYAKHETARRSESTSIWILPILQNCQTLTSTYGSIS